jgi:hypothetical protein
MGTKNKASWFGDIKAAPVLDVASLKSTMKKVRRLSGPVMSWTPRACYFGRRCPHVSFFYVLVKTIHEIFLHENSPPSLTLQELSMYILFLALLGMIECILVRLISCLFQLI